MKVILASLITLPRLVNGKVVVINEDGTYSMYRPSLNTRINDNFDPMDYAILKGTKYRECIVHTSKEEVEHYLVNKMFRELRNPIPQTYRAGDKIHLHSRRGVYELVEIYQDSLKITCGKWRYDANPYHIVSKRDFKCLAGGLFNAVFK